MKMTEFSKKVEKTVGKGEICTLQAISPFPIVFSKDLFCRQEKKGLFGKKRDLWNLRDALKQANHLLTHSHTMTPFDAPENTF